MRRKLAATAAAVTAMVVLAFCVPLALVVRVVAHDRAVHSAELESRSLAAVLAGTRDATVLATIVDQANAGSARPAAVYLPNGTVVGTGHATDAGLTRARTGEAFTDEYGDGVTVYAPVQTVDGVSVVAVYVPAKLVNQGVGSAWLVLGALAVALILLAVALSDRLGRSFVTPMQHLRDVAVRLREGDRDARAEATGPNEVAEVANALNQLADRIDDLLAAEREAAADLSHRLRTPLTALRLDVERLTDADERARLTAEVAALETAVDGLIRAARAAPNRSTGPVDAVEVIRDRLAFWSVLAENQRRPLTVDLAEAKCAIATEPEQIEAAVDAIIGNIFKHTPEATAMHVRFDPPHGARNGDPARPGVLVVEDEGPGVAGDDVIVRGASSTGSTGLGLDIARQFAESLGGELRVQQRQKGGTRVELLLGPAPSRPLRASSAVSRR